MHSVERQAIVEHGSAAQTHHARAGLDIRTHFYPARPLLMYYRIRPSKTILPRERRRRHVQWLDGQH